LGTDGWFGGDGNRGDDRVGDSDRDGIKKQAFFFGIDNIRSRGKRDGDLELAEAVGAQGAGGDTSRRIDDFQGNPGERGTGEIIDLTDQDIGLVGRRDGRER